MLDCEFISNGIEYVYIYVYIYIFQDILYSLHPSRPPLRSTKPRAGWESGSFPEVKCLEDGAEHQHQHSTGIKNEWSHNSATEFRTTTTYIMASQRLSRFMVQNENWNVYRDITWCDNAVLYSSSLSPVAQLKRLDISKTWRYVCNGGC